MTPVTLLVTHTKLIAEPAAVTNYTVVTAVGSMQDTYTQYKAVSSKSIVYFDCCLGTLIIGFAISRPVSAQQLMQHQYRFVIKADSALDGPDGWIGWSCVMRSGLVPTSITWLCARHG